MRPPERCTSNEDISIWPTAIKCRVSVMPGNDGFRFNLGTTLTFFGQLEEAERELEACLAINPGHWKAHHSLAQLRKQTMASNHIERLSSLLPKVVGRVTATTYLNMALAKDLAARGAEVMLAGGGGDLPTLSAHPILEPIVRVQGFYRMANQLSILRGHDPDRPPHLNKVTETV